MVRWIWLIFLCGAACAIELSGAHLENKDGGTMPVKGVEVGAVSLTDLFKAAWNGDARAEVAPGAFTGTATFCQPLATISAPLTVNAPPIDTRFEYGSILGTVNNTSPLVSLTVSKDAMPVTINAPVTLTADFSRFAQAVQTAGTDVQTWMKVLAAGLAVVVLGISCAWWLHHRGQERLIAHLKGGSSNG